MKRREVGRVKEEEERWMEVRHVVDGIGRSENLWVRNGMVEDERNESMKMQVLTFIFTMRFPPCFSIELWIASIARSRRSTAAYYSEHNNQHIPPQPTEMAYAPCPSRSC
jgi:hypothetical protein